MFGRQPPQQTDSQLAAPQPGEHEDGAQQKAKMIMMMILMMIMMLPEAQGQYKDAVVITLARVGGGIRQVSRADLIKKAPGVLILVMEALTGGRVTPGAS